LFLYASKKKEKEELHVWAEIGTRDLFCCIEERLGFFARREPIFYLFAVCIISREEWFLLFLDTITLVYVPKSVAFVERLVIILYSAPLEVFDAVVAAIAIFVIDNRKVFRIGKERARDEAVDERFSIDPKSSIPTTTISSQELARFDAKDAPVAIE
jgi:hypothetical protein